jgi:Gram-negative bacterial TonB protein C-terminal
MHELGRWKLGSLPPEKQNEHVEELPAHRLRRRSYPLVAVLMLVPGALGYGVYLTWRASQPPGSSFSKGAVLALRAERREDAVRVSWNPNTPVVNHATDAVLSIRDGDLQPQPLHLTLAQLLNGSVVYGPSKNNVQVWLEISGPDNTRVGETVLAPEAPKAEWIARAGRPGADSSSRSRGLSDDLIVDPPPTPILRPEASVLTQQLAGVQPKLGPPPPLEPQQSGTAQRQPQHLPAPVFVAAHALFESRPNLSFEIRETITSELELQVKVQIDESGRVVKIDSVQSTGPASHSLFRATEDAARLWKFAPAMRGDQPVPSEAILSFRYSPKAAGN